MPTDYECPNCRLAFSVGWYHYHGVGTGYGARTLLVCSSCGIQHSIEHPVRRSEEKRPIALESYEDLVVDCKRVIPNGPLFPDRKWARRVSIENEDLAHLSCQSCGSAGTLRKDWPIVGAPCPRCGEKISKAIGKWMT
ncbi:hypothetical protein ASA1KI_03580 [Opitutales bacterium ASA1]|nr:hypothetical protein ASA1KI_03580 [Opitutales bacterium ASA1]